MEPDPNPPAVRQATLDDLESVVPLFDAYRQFYRKPGDPRKAREFLLERIRRRQSVILLAWRNDTAVGFTQMYPSFSSASMAAILILNDLYVALETRGVGVGAALLRAAADYARRVGAIRLALQTELTNRAAQSLYEKEGWKRDDIFCSYTLEL